MARYMLLQTPNNVKNVKSTGHPDRGRLRKKVRSNSTNGYGMFEENRVRNLLKSMTATNRFERIGREPKMNKRDLGYYKGERVRCIHNEQPFSDDVIIFRKFANIIETGRSRALSGNEIENIVWVRRNATTRRA